MSNRHYTSIALPTALLLASMISNANAANVGAEAAAQLLAKAHVADGKCHYLETADREELSSLVARAEVALASQSNVATTKATMAAGRAAGISATCSPALQVEIENVLSAARSASQRAQSGGDSGQNVEPAIPQAITSTEPSTVAPKPRTSAGLATYAAMTARYYKARRCFSMPRSAMNSFYQDVVATHHLMVKTYGVRAVAAVMHQSESAADRQGCG